MRIGVPKEIKNLEYRVGLTPSSVRELIDHGHELWVEKHAGLAIGFADELYASAGARIAENAQEIFDGVEMIVKVKEPQPEECAMLREGQILFTYLHLAPDTVQTRGLINSGCTAVAYETVTDDFGGLPLLAPMSEVAGRMSIQAGAHALEMAQGGRGTLMGGVPGVAPAKVTIIGGGVVGTNAARMAIGLGAETLILDRSIHRLQYLDDLFQGRVRVEFSTATTIETHVLSSDLVIGAVLIPGAEAPKLVSKGLVARMLRGSVLVDVAIDQGGCFETSRATTHQHPTYNVDGVVHYCVANMPGAVARTSTLALNNSTLPYTIALANYGTEALLAHPHLLNGLNVHRGQVTYEAVSVAQDLDYVPAEEALRG
ncbi:MAG: alanine dehydrogenase [Desulfuromonas sp.]|nr:MAG: alanine dehydrogenase [Desulfuromonas sp.]